MLVNIYISKTQNNSTYIQHYPVEVLEKRTVLGLLLEISAQQDPTLSFRYGCRFKHCGLCAAVINGRSQPSCLYEVKGDVKIEPLKGFPILRDLIIDRLPYNEMLKERGVYPRLPFEDKSLLDNKFYKTLLGCTDCYCCLSECPKFIEDKNFLGPLYYVKLAQLFLNPGSNYVPSVLRDDLLQCMDCMKCYCPYGLPLKKVIKKIGELVL